MSIQAITGGGRLYDQNRDLAHNFGWVLHQAAQRFANRRWAVVEEFLRAQGVEDQQLVDGLQALFRFVEAARDGDGTDMKRDMAVAGWDQVPEPVRLAIMAHCGAILLGAFYVGVNQAMIAGDDPTKRYPDLWAGGREFARLMEQSRLRRLARWMWDDFKGWFLGLFRSK